MRWAYRHVPTGSGLTKTRVKMEDLEQIFQDYRPDDDDFFDELEELLIMADMGVDTVDRVVTSMHYLCFDKNIKRGDKAREVLIDELKKELDAGNSALKLGTKPSVILMVGVNGVGKTTTIGKLAALLKSQGKKVLLCAGDTFRAAAADQLEIWADRAGVDIVRHEEGSDPAAVVYDGICAGKARDTDVIIIDTAGRLHNKANLMSELSKMRRIIDRELPDADVETLMVLDATTGQNGLIQAEQFLETAGLTGIVLTKLDGTAKGGVVFAIASRLKLPVKFVGVGEGIDDLIPFNPKDYIEALFK